MRSSVASNDSNVFMSRPSFVSDAGTEVLGQRVADKMLFNDHWTVTKWARNDEQPNCFNCSRKFSIFCRYHHCRSCGNCICNGCSVFKPLPCFGYAKARICKYCCGSRHIEVQVDGREEKKKYVFSPYSRSKEAAHQDRCVKALVAEKVFMLGKFGVRCSEYAETHAGVINTRAVNVKCFRKWLIKSNDRGLIINEINTLRIFHHPNISRVIRTNILKDGVSMPEFPYIMTEYAEFGTLGEFLVERYVEKTHNKSKERSMQDWQLLVRMLTQLLGTLKYLDEVHHLMHNDIHSGNVLVVADSLWNDLSDEPNVLIKLTDFTNTRDSEPATSALKPIPTHRAVEVQQNEPYDASADVFSVGQTIAQVLLIKPKNFLVNYASAEDAAVVIGDAIANRVMPPIAKEKSAIGIELADLVRECWSSAEERPSFAALEEKLVSLEARYFPASVGRRSSLTAASAAAAAPPMAMTMTMAGMSPLSPVPPLPSP
jgi:serine/threonine protein kinase